MAPLSGVFARFNEFERNFNGSEWIGWTRNHAEAGRPRFILWSSHLDGPWSIFEAIELA